jgi:hypothetical protein
VLISLIGHYNISYAIGSQIEVRESVLSIPYDYEVLATGSGTAIQSMCHWSNLYKPGSLILTRPRNDFDCIHCNPLQFVSRFGLLYSRFDTNTMNGSECSGQISENKLNYTLIILIN